MKLTTLSQMKRDGHKAVGVVAWDVHLARIADRVGVDIVSVGDSVGSNLWGDDNPYAVTLDEMLTLTKAVRRGTSRALVSADFPFGPLQEGTASTVRAAVRFVKEAGVDMVKLDGAASHLDAVETLSVIGIPVFAQFGITPQSALRYGIEHGGLSEMDVQIAEGIANQLVADARRLEEAGASLLDFTNSGPVVGPRVVEAVSIPVLGGKGGGPWLDGRIRMAHAAIGYDASALDDPPETYANVARSAFDALTAYADDVRGGRQIKGGMPTL